MNSLRSSGKFTKIARCEKSEGHDSNSDTKESAGKSKDDEPKGHQTLDYVAKQAGDNDLGTNDTLNHEIETLLTKSQIVHTESSEEGKLSNQPNSFTIDFQSSSILPEDLEVIRKIGNGSFGKVYLCKSNKTGEQYALKVVDKDTLKSPALKKYAITERQILSMIKNQFVVSLKLSFQTSTHCFLLMDYCPGSDIASYLDTEGCFSEAKARFYILECIAALDALHKQGVVYRDLKPNNIMLDSHGHIKLIDFNLCKTGMVNSLQRTKSF